MGIEERRRHGVAARAWARRGGKGIEELRGGRACKSGD